MAAALLLPKLLDRLPDRTVMLVSAVAMTGVLAVLALSWRAQPGPADWPLVLTGWLLLGTSYAASITPGGRLLRRSSGAADRPALFAAQFALSHVCWLVAYPLAGQLGARFGMGVALGGSTALALLGTIIAPMLWPATDPDIVEHHHDGLPADHPHLKEGHGDGRASHVYVIDEIHPRWPG